MNTMKSLLISAVVAAVIAGLIGFYFHTPVAQPLGAAGSTFSFPVSFLDNVTTGGYDYNASITGTVTYNTVAFARARVIEHIATTTTTVSIPTNAALSAAGFLPNVGDTSTTFIHASTTLITLSGNTGVTLGTASTSAKISPGQTGTLQCARLGAAEARLIQCILTTD